MWKHSIFRVTLIIGLGNLAKYRACRYNEYKSQYSRGVVVSIWSIRQLQIPYYGVVRQLMPCEVTQEERLTAEVVEMA